MQLIVDQDLREVIADFGNRSALGAISIKSEDALDLDVYFVKGGDVQDLGAGLALKFGLIKTGDVSETLLAEDATFTRVVDPTSGNVFYQSIVELDTAQMRTAMAGSTTSPPRSAARRVEIVTP